MTEPRSAQLLRRPSIIDEHLASLLQTVCIEVEAGSELLDDGILHRLTGLLSSERAERAAEILAEMAKSEDNRIVFIQQQVIPPLVALVHNSPPPTLRQACRAMGNMCFESQTGRQIVLSEGGIAALISRLTELKPVKSTTHAENSVHYMLCGSLHTICMDHEEVQKEAIRLHCFPVLIDYLKHTSEPPVLRFCLNIISTLLDHGEQLVNAAIEHGLASIVSDILKSHKENDDVREAVLDVLGNFHLLEMPMTQMQLYQAGIISHLIDIINTSLDETDNHASERIASEILVFIVSHDGIAQLAFEDESLQLVSESMQWMLGYHEHLKGTGALVIGNLATSDLRSNELSKQPQLIDTLFKVLTSEYSSHEMMIKVRHAALSALRNLSICETAKPLVRPYLPTLMSYTAHDMPMLVFKAVGCIRLLTRGNKDVAALLAADTNFIQTLSELPEKYKLHAGIRAEAPRLLATIIVEPVLEEATFTDMLKCNIAGLLLDLTTTKQHPQLQVEGWLAIQKVLKGGSEEHVKLFLSDKLLSCLELCLADDTNPNVRILALSIIRMVCPSLSKEDDVEKLTEQLDRLAVDNSDIPAQKLAIEVKDTLPGFK